MWGKMVCSLRDTISSFVSKRILRFEISEGFEEMGSVITEYRCLVGAFGAALAAGLAWRWIRRSRKKAGLNDARKEKQAERKRAFERLRNQIHANQLPNDLVESITKLTISELLDQLKAGRFTAVQVLTAYQIKALQVHEKTNCITEPVLEALEWAQELDRSTSKGPLHGLPISLKECVSIKGYDVTAGCSKWIGEPFAEDAVLVQVLKQQGAIPFMRTNLPQTMISFESTNPIFGRTNNPHNLNRSGGGSSGGEGALIGGGGSLLGVGSDVGGSIRNPGAMCGVPAFKPTALRVSKKGGRVLLAGKNILSCWGPLGQGVESLILFMKSVLVPDMYRLDPVLPVMPFRDEVLTDQRPLRIGYSLFNGVFEAVPAMQRAVIEAKKLLEASGHQLIPWNEDLSRVAELWIPCMFADGGKEMYEILEFDEVDDAMELVKFAISLPICVRRLLAFLLKPFRPESSEKLKATCGFKNVSALWDAIREIKSLQNGIIERWQKDNLDAIICPAFGSSAVSNGLQQHLYGVITYTSVFNILDFPGGCVPVTTVSERDEIELEQYPRTNELRESYWLLKKDMKGTVGLPVSAQVVTLPWQDELCLRVMSDLEKAVQQNQKHD